MLQLLLHLLGDYFIQNDWMALNKKKKSWTGELACQIHCITYSLPFLLIASWYAVIGIYLMHYLFDRTNIVAWFIALKNGQKSIKNFGFSPDRPFAITIWLLIIADNSLHIAINYFLITLLP